MPTSLLDADLKFANLGKKTDLKSRVDGMESYLYQLLEQLRYSFGNLDRTNFNDAGFAEISGIISQPIIAEIKGIDGQITQITATSAALTTRVEDAEGNITALYQFADEITQKVEDAEGNITTLTATAQGLSTRVTNAEGNITTLTATAQGLSTRVTNAEGSISTLTQTAESLTIKVSSVEGSVSTVSQTVNSISLGVTNESESSTIKLYRNGIAVSSQTIQFTGLVSFSDLEGDGTTVINGNNITTGEIRAINYIAEGDPSGGTYNVFSVEDGAGNQIGAIGYQWLSSEGNVGDRLWIRTEQYGRFYPSIKIEAAGRLSIEANNGSYGFVYIYSAGDMTISADGDINIFQGGTTWEFRSGNLYKGGTMVL